MILWWCVAAEAKKPAPPASDDGVAGAWYREFRPNVARSMGLGAEVRRLLVVTDAAAAEARREEILAEASVAREVLAAMPRFEPDPTLALAADGWFETLAGVSADLPRLWVLYTSPPIDDADLAAASVYWLSITRRLDAADAAWLDAELAFASRNGVKLAGREVFEAPSVFTPPHDLVPEGCPLPPEAVARLASGYRDQLEALVGRLIVAWEGADSREAVAALNEIRGVGPWQHDEDLRNAALSVGVSVLAALSSPSGVDERVAGAIAAFQATSHEFEVQWALAHWREWAKRADRR